MDTLKAYDMAQAAKARGAKMRVFDWNRAAQIIKERNAKNASAGLQDDWEYTGGEILKNGKPVPQEDTYTYLASIWAVPELYVDGEFIPCWVYEKESSFNEETYWPASALAILNS